MVFAKWEIPTAHEYFTHHREEKKQIIGKQTVLSKDRYHVLLQS